MIGRALLLCAVLASLGCGLTGKAVRSLTDKEVAYLQALRTRTEGNGKKLNEVLATLGDLSSRAVAREHTLALDVAKARLLESMRSPWVVSGQPAMQQTQRAVALYHLYALADAERAVVDAKVKERQAALRAVADAYGQLSTLLDRAIENEKTVLAYMNQPAAAKIGDVVTAFLHEVEAFHKQLSSSEHPELRALAEDVARAESRIEKAKDRIEDALQRLR